MIASFFCKAQQESCTWLKNLLGSFCNNSGQLINFNKSSLTFSKNASTTKKWVVSGIFNIMQSNGLGKYLGYSVFQGKPSITTFQDIINKATDKLNGWKANCLSKAGRTILIQSHLESIPAHTVQCFHLPKHTTEQIDKTNWGFLWGKSNTEKGLSLTAWDKICMPKNKGGVGTVGLCYTDAVNKAFQCKLAWKMLTND